MGCDVARSVVYGNRWHILTHTFVVVTFCSRAFPVFPSAIYIIEFAARNESTVVQSILGL